MKVEDNTTASVGSGMPMTRAILLYERTNAAIATIHPVTLKGEEAAAKPVIGPGRCLTREALEEIVLSLSRASGRRAILPQEILCADASCLCWWRPSVRRSIFFSTGDKEFSKAMNAREVTYPPLVFIAKAGGILSVFAIPERSRRPDADTKLYRAPFMNLYENGQMCAGNVRLPETLIPSETPVWESAFYDTRFTHTNLHTGKVTLFEGGHNALWRAMAEPMASFPAESLVDLKLTLEEAVNP